jgi:thiamine pyrophosphokinase
MRAYIFANGVMEDPAQTLVPDPHDLVISADGGSRHCQELNLIPDVLIGDLDSADPELAASWERDGVEVIRHPEDKDQTDLELALLLAQERGAEEIRVYGAVGGRLDMTFGNLTLLAHPELTVPATLICGLEEVHLMKPGDTLELEGVPGELLSLIPLQPGSATVTAQGVRYPLHDEDLFFGTTRGISNCLADRRAVIRLSSGLLAVVHTRSQMPKEG